MIFVKSFYLFGKRSYLLMEVKNVVEQGNEAPVK